MARVPIGLAVKNGAPYPDISSVEAFKRTLLDARSIAYVDPASGGTRGGLSVRQWAEEYHG